MKYISVFFLLILMSVATQAQDTEAPKRDISLLVLNKKGRPISNIIVRSAGSTKAGMTNHSGLFVFNDMTDEDQISMMLPKYGETFIPVAGMDSIVVTLRSARRYSYVYNDEQNVIIDKRDNRTDANTLLDVQELLEQHPYASLVDLLQGANVAGLNISTSGRAGGDASASIRGPNSLMSSSEPLVVVDGLPIGGLNDANQSVNVYDIKTIEVQKSSSEWGVRSANGVILVNTK
jgi:hypothetical protein